MKTFTTRAVALVRRDRDQPRRRRVLEVRDAAAGRHRRARAVVDADLDARHHRQRAPRRPRSSTRPRRTRSPRRPAPSSVRSTRAARRSRSTSRARATARPPTSPSRWRATARRASSPSATASTSRVTRRSGRSRAPRRSVQNAGDKFIKAPASAGVDDPEPQPQRLPREGLRRGHAAASWPQDVSEENVGGVDCWVLTDKKGKDGGRALRLQGQVRGRPLHRLDARARASSTSPSGTRTSASRRPSRQPDHEDRLSPATARSRAVRSAAGRRSFGRALVGRSVSCSDGAPSRDGSACSSASDASAAPVAAVAAGPRCERRRRHGRADPVQQDRPAAMADRGAGRRPRRGATSVPGWRTARVGGVGDAGRRPRRGAGRPVGVVRSPKRPSAAQTRGQQRRRDPGVAGGLGVEPVLLNISCGSARELRRRAGRRARRPGRRPRRRRPSGPRPGPGYQRRASSRSGWATGSIVPEVGAGADDDLGAGLAQAAHRQAQVAHGDRLVDPVGHVVGADHDQRHVGLGHLGQARWRPGRRARRTPPR